MQKMQFEWSNWISEVVFSVDYAHRYMHSSAVTSPSIVISGSMISEQFPGIGHYVCLEPAQNTGTLVTLTEDNARLHLDTKSFERSQRTIIKVQF